jgi:hypothetical protein
LLPRKPYRTGWRQLTELSMGVEELSVLTGSFSGTRVDTKSLLLLPSHTVPFLPRMYKEGVDAAVHEHAA